MKGVPENPRPEDTDIEDVESNIREAAADVGIEDIDSGIFSIPGSVAPTAVSLVTVGLQEVDLRGDVAIHRIVTEEFRIGRHPECNLVLPEDGKVSRRHARIHRSGEDWFIEDNGSANGTLVNGQRLERPCALKSGDRIAIGCRTFTFVKWIDPPPST